MINVHENMKWKNGKNYPKSVVITDFSISTSIKDSEYKRAVGTAGWAPPEQWLGQDMKWSVFLIFYPSSVIISNLKIIS